MKTTTKGQYILNGKYLSDFHTTAARQGKGAVLIVELAGLRITATIERI